MLSAEFSLNIVPWDYPNLSNRSATTSPFTIVFKLAGSREYTLVGRGSFSFFVGIAASFMNTVVLTSVLSAGNHALFAGTRVLYGQLFFLLLAGQASLNGQQGYLWRLLPRPPNSSRGRPLEAYLFPLCF